MEVKCVKVIFTILLFFRFGTFFAQTFYSTDQNYLKFKKEGNNILTNYQSQYPDTSVEAIHNFFPRNYSGNVGLPSPEYLLGFGTSDLGLRFYKEPYTNDRFYENEISYFKSKGPYAQLTGIAGSKQLQIFKLLFTHTIKERFNIALKFNRYTSTGFYLRQQTFINNFYITSNYTSKSNRNGFYFYMLNNGNRHQENGGISGDTLSEINLLVGKDLLPVKISNAVRDNKEYKGCFNPWFKLNKNHDSTDGINHYLQLKSKFNFNTYEYKDVNMRNDAFYFIMYHDTVSTFDSSAVMQFINEVDYSLGSGKNFGISFGYKNEINKVWQKADSLFSNHIINSDVFFRKDFFGNDSIKTLRTHAESKLNAQYVVNGTNSGNYKIEINNFASFGRSQRHTVFLNLLYEKRNPDYIYNYWVSNHFTWFNNGYLPQDNLNAQLGYNFNKRIGVSVILQDLNNYLFFDNVGLPRQYAGHLQNAGITAHYSHVFFRHLGLFIQHTYQSTSNNAYISLPENISTARLFYTGSLFRHNLQLQIGGQVEYYSSFYGYAYMPATQVFYLQDQFKTSEYPYLDIYLNARIRPVNVFLKVENVLQGFAGTGYSFVPGYYQPDRAFRFGISWMFFD